MSAELDNLIGNLITIILLNEVRYDGILFSINSKEASVVLRDVKCKGTEDRVQDPTKKVPSSSAVMNFVIFPGNEIQDLYVHEEPVEEPVVPPAPPKVQEITINQTTAIVESAAFNNLPIPPKKETLENLSNENKIPASNSNNQNRNNASHRQVTSQGAAAVGGVGVAHSSNVGKGEHLLQGRKPHGTKELDKAIKAKEFDISSANAGFDKAVILAEVAASTTSEAVKYSKDSFFDNLSCESIDRAEGRSMRITGQAERKMNLDTFGAIAARSNHHRGGYGNYRGGGRGGAGGGGYRGHGGGGGRRGGGRGGGGRGRGGGGGAQNIEKTEA